MDNISDNKKESTLTSLYDKFAGIPLEVLRNPNISSGAKMVLTAIISYDSYGQGVWPGQERLMYELGIKNRKTIKKYLDELRKLGLLAWEQESFQGTNHYTLFRVPEKLKREYGNYEARVKQYRESGGKIQKPWLLEKGDQKITNKIDEEEIGNKYRLTQG